MVYLENCDPVYRFLIIFRQMELSAVDRWTETCSDALWSPVRLVRVNLRGSVFVMLIRGKLIFQEEIQETIWLQIPSKKKCFMHPVLTFFLNVYKIFIALAFFITLSSSLFVWVVSLLIPLMHLYTVPFP